MTQHQICLIFALSCFIAAAGWVKGLSWRDAGFAFIVLSFLIG